MFDIGFFELLVVGGVSLVVIGPERLPGAIKTGALWIGRLKRTLADTRREIEQHIGADEIRRELRNEEIMASLEQLRKAREQLERDIQKEVHATTLEHNPVHDEPNSILDEHNQNPVTIENSEVLTQIQPAPSPSTSEIHQAATPTTANHPTAKP